MNKKLIIWLCLAIPVIGLLAGGAVVYASDRDEDDSGSNGVVADTLEENAENFGESMEAFGKDMIECAKGFPMYLTTIIELDNFSTYWVDIFEKNMCQLDDIFALDDILDDIQTDIRSKYYSCDMSGIEELERLYLETKVELDFVRSSVNLKSEAMNKDDIGEALAAVNIYIASELRSKMTEKYVTNLQWFTEEEFDELFIYFQEDYQDNIENYVDCTGTSWQAIIDKWEELTTMFQELKPSEEDKQFWTEEEKEARENNKPSIKFGLETNFDDYAAKIKQEATIEIPEPSEYIDTKSGTITSIFDDYVETGAQYAREVEAAELMSRYELLYGAGGADISDSFVAALKMLDATLNNTIEPTLFEVEKLTYDISKKQGGD